MASQLTASGDDAYNEFLEFLNSEHANLEEPSAGGAAPQIEREISRSRVSVYSEEGERRHSSLILSRLDSVQFMRDMSEFVDSDAESDIMDVQMDVHVAQDVQAKSDDGSADASHVFSVEQDKDVTNTQPVVSNSKPKSSVSINNSEAAFYGAMVENKGASFYGATVENKEGVFNTNADAHVPNQVTQSSPDSKSSKPSPLSGGSAQYANLLRLDAIIATPFLIFTLPLLFVMVVTIVTFLVLMVCLLIAIALPLVPVVLLIVLRPKRLLYGYQDLAVVCNNYYKNEVDSFFGSKDGSGQKHAIVPDEPFVLEMQKLMAFSDFVYMHIDFRRLSALGKIPIPFKYIMLECDEMKQSDIINGVPHSKPAFLPDGTPTGTGMMPSTLLVITLRFLVAEAERQRIQNLTSVISSAANHFLRLKRLESHKDMTEDEEQFDGEDDAGIDGEREQETLGSVLGERRRTRMTDMRPTMMAAAKEKTHYTTLEKKLSNEKVYEGLAEFENLFKKSLLHVPKECDHKLEQGHENCQELMNILTEAVDDDMDIDNDITRVTALLNSITDDGILFKQNSIAFLAIKVVNNIDTRVVWTNDRNGDSECVYIIAVSYKKRRVTVIFRGTTTYNDIMKNADFAVMPMPNPVYNGTSDLDAEIKINHGYGQYLFVERDDTRRTKFDEIADRADMFGRELGSGYSLYVTGHSMGGALAAMFGFYASVDKRFAQAGNPVRVYTFNAAIPGRVSFAKAFQHQERKGLLQHLRISSDSDIVPLAHPQSELDFAHTGISICMHDDKIPSVKYVHDSNWWSTLTANILTNLWVNFPWLNPSSVGSNHSMNSLAKRLKQAQDEINYWGLLKVTLSDLYSALDMYEHMDCVMEEDI